MAVVKDPKEKPAGTTDAPGTPPANQEASPTPQVVPVIENPASAPVVTLPKPKSRTELKQEHYALLRTELDEEVRTHYTDANDFGTRLHMLAAQLKRIHQTRDPMVLEQVKRDLPSIQEHAEAFRLSPIIEAIQQLFAVLDAEAALNAAAKRTGGV